MRAVAKILRARAIRAKAKFGEHFQIEWDHSIPLIVLCKVILFAFFVRHFSREMSQA